MQLLCGWRKYTTVLQIVAGYIGGMVAGGVTGNLVSMAIPDQGLDFGGGFDAMGKIFGMSIIAYLLVVALGVWLVGRIRSGNGMYLLTLMGAFAGGVLIVGIFRVTGLTLELDHTWNLIAWLVLFTLPPILATLAHNKI
jgi:hypothetical protein